MKALVKRVGDETALILPSEIVKMLDLKEGHALFLRRLDDSGFRLGRTDPVQDEVMDIARQVLDEHSGTFEALAKS
jgi:antitoxin component of MazEF toxin-antitoxin module